MGNVINLKPLVQVQGSGNFQYRNNFTAYILGDIPIFFETDLDEEQFTKFIDGEYSKEEIETLEKRLNSWMN